MNFNYFLKIFELITNQNHNIVKYFENFITISYDKGRLAYINHSENLLIELYYYKFYV